MLIKFLVWCDMFIAYNKGCATMNGQDLTHSDQWRVMSSDHLPTPAPLTVNQGSGGRGGGVWKAVSPFTAHATCHL